MTPHTASGTASRSVGATTPSGTLSATWHATWSGSTSRSGETPSTSATRERTNPSASATVTHSGSADGTASVSRTGPARTRSLTMIVTATHETASLSMTVTSSYSCSARQSIVFLAGSQVQSLVVVGYSNVTSGDGAGAIALASEEQRVAAVVPYDVMRSGVLVAVLTFRPRLALRGSIVVDSGEFSVEVVNVSQPPASRHLQIALRLDGRDSVNLINVRALSGVAVSLTLSLGTIPACQLLVPSVFEEVIRVVVQPPIARQPVSVTATAVAGGVVSSAMANPTPAIQQGYFLSFVDMAACAFSDVEQLEPSTSPFGMSVGRTVGQYYRGAVGAFLLCMCACVAMSTAAVFVLAKGKGTSLLAAAAWVHFPSVLIVPFAMLLGGAVTSSVSLLRLSLSGGDVVLALAGLGASCGFVALVCMAISRSWWFVCVSEERELPEDGRVPALLQHLFRFTEPVTGWVDESPGMFKRRYLLFFNDNRSSWYCGVELAVAVAVSAVQGVRVNSTMYCLAAATVLLTVHGLVLMLCIAARPCAARSDNVFLLVSKAITVSCAAVTVASILRYDNSLLGVVTALGTCGSFIEDVHTAVTVIAFVCKVLLDWKSRVCSAAIRSRAGPVQLADLIGGASSAEDDGAAVLPGSMTVSSHEGWRRQLRFGDGSEEDGRFEEFDRQVGLRQLSLSSPPLSSASAGTRRSTRNGETSRDGIEAELALRRLLGHMVSASRPDMSRGECLVHLVSAACCSTQRMKGK